MVRGIAYSNVCQSFFSPSARTQFLFSLPPFARHLWRCFLKNVYESLSLRDYKKVHDHPFIVLASPSFPFLFCFITHF